MIFHRNLCKIERCLALCHSATTYETCPSRRQLRGDQNYAEALPGGAYRGAYREGLPHG